MQNVVALIGIILGIAVIFYFQPGTSEKVPLSEIQNIENIAPAQVSTPVKNTASQKTYQPTTYTPAPETTSKPSILLETFINSGPKDGEIIWDTNKVAFEFEGWVWPRETEGKITFETKVEGFDTEWKKTYSQERIITLPAGPKEYTFFARSRINDVVDSTPAQRTFKINVSPYFKKITFSSVSSQTNSRPSLIRLGINLSQDEEINISGWLIGGRKGSFVIPNGIEKYSPYNPEPVDDIIVKRGDTIYLSGAYNPLGQGLNFRLNKCMGYFTNYYSFPISISKNCPKPTQKEISHLDPCCQQFINNLGRCVAPEYSNKISIISDPQCTSFLTDNLNYAACFYKYSQDADFLKNEWHIYMGRNFISGECDTLYLKDEDGLIVNSYKYGSLICN